MLGDMRAKEQTSMQLPRWWRHADIGTLSVDNFRSPQSESTELTETSRLGQLADLVLHRKGKPTKKAA